MAMRWKVLVTAPYMQPEIDRFRSVFDADNIELLVPPVKERCEEKELLQWIRSHIKDDELARGVSKSKDKKELEANIIANLLNDGITKKYILQYICYPLIKEKTK